MIYVSPLRSFLAAPAAGSGAIGVVVRRMLLPALLLAPVPAAYAQAKSDGSQYLGQWEVTTHSMDAAFQCKLGVGRIGESFVVRDVTANRGLEQVCGHFVGIYTLTPQGNLKGETAGLPALAFDKSNNQVVASAGGRLEYLRRVTPALLDVRREMRIVATAFHALYVDFASYYLIDPQRSDKTRPMSLDNRNDGPRTAAVVKQALTPFYLAAKNFPTSDQYGNEYRFSIGRQGKQFSIRSLGEDHRLGTGDDVLYIGEAGSGDFAPAP